MAPVTSRPRPPWLERACQAAGAVGPIVFSTAWLVNGRRQHDYSPVDEHISGLAALDADHPRTSMAGFLVLGTCTMAFATAVHRALGGRGRAGIGPALLFLSGAGAVSAGLLRRDTVLLNPPDRPAGYEQSWHNDGHDLSAAVIYTCAVTAPLAIARKVKGDPAWHGVAPAAVGASVASLGLMAFFATDVDRHGNGLVQRAMVTLPQALLVAASIRLLRRPLPR